MGSDFSFSSKNKARVAGGRFPHCAETGNKGGILFPKRIPPLNPPEKGEGSSPRPPTLAVCRLKSCTRCALHSRWQLCCLTDVAYPLRVIRCGVHGFAMNPCESLRLATAPYYREARVTVARRQTACGMRHCFARRIDETGDRRKLGCTPTRWAERQRIVGVGQIVSQLQTRQRRVMGSAIGKH